MARDAERRYPRALEHVYAHTSHVVARSDLDPEGVKRILGGIGKLASITYVKVFFCLAPKGMVVGGFF